MRRVLSAAWYTLLLIAVVGEPVWLLLPLLPDSPPAWLLLAL